MSQPLVAGCPCGRSSAVLLAPETCLCGAQLDQACVTWSCCVRLQTLPFGCHLLCVMAASRGDVLRSLAQITALAAYEEAVQNAINSALSRLTHSIDCCIAEGVFCHNAHRVHRQLHDQPRGPIAPPSCTRPWTQRLRTSGGALCWTPTFASSSSTPSLDTRASICRALRDSRHQFFHGFLVDTSPNPRTHSPQISPSVETLCGASSEALAPASWRVDDMVGFVTVRAGQLLVSADATVTVH